MRGFLLFILMLGVFPLYAQPEIEPLIHCINNLKQSRDFYQKRLPYWFYGIDSKLHQMVMGIRFLDENASLVKARYEGKSLSKWDKHLVSNSLIGCEKYLKSFESRARILLFLLISIGILILTLTLRIMLYLSPDLPEERKKKEKDFKESSSAVNEKNDIPLKGSSRL